MTNGEGPIEPTPEPLEEAGEIAATPAEPLVADSEPAEPSDPPREPESGEADPEAGEEALADSKEAVRWRERNRSLLPESWRVELPIFQGPLDLLLHLIKINRVEIVDIPVALICDQFQEYLSLMEELDLDIAGEYIYEAAVLIQLKSKMLLPQPRLDDGEESAEDPRAELVQRLLDYQRLKEAAQTLAEVDSIRHGLWTREKQRIAPDPEQEQVSLDEVSLFDLLKAFRQVLVRYDAEHPEPLQFHGEVYSVRSQVELLLERLDPKRPVDLLDHLLGLSCRAEAIAAFLAVLEMTKMALLRLSQSESGAILLYRTEREMQSHEWETLLA